MATETGYLVKYEPDGREGERWEITRVPLTIGRSREALILLRSKKVSRMHCVFLQEKPGHYTLEDTLSTNGTWVNDQRIEKVVLQPYDRIRVGETQFVFKMVYEMHVVETIHSQREILQKRTKPA